MCVNKNTSIPDFPFYDFISFTFFLVYNGGIHMFEITVSYTQWQKCYFPFQNISNVQNHLTTILSIDVMKIVAMN